MKRKSFIKPPFRIYTIRPSDQGASALYVIREKNVAEPCSVEVCSGMVWSWLNEQPDIFRELKISLKQAESVVRGLLIIEPVATRKPKMVGFKSDNEVCLKRHDWDPIIYDNDEDAIAASPEAMRLITNPVNHEFMAAWLGSAFDPDADRKKVLWIYGPKDCGKSQLFWVINEIFGNVVPVDNETFKSKEFTAYIENSRIAIVNESSNYILMSNRFKNLTGDSMHPIRHLYRTMYVGEIPTMFIFISNNDPGVNNDPAVLSRIIPCKMTPVEDDFKMPVADLRGFLGDALPIITGYWIKKHADLGSLSMRNDYSTEDLEEAVYDFNESEINWIEEQIVIDENVCIKPLVLENRLRNYGFSPQTKKKIKELLYTRYGVKKKKDADGTRWLYGLKLSTIQSNFDESSHKLIPDNEKDLAEISGNNLSNVLHLKSP